MTPDLQSTLEAMAQDQRGPVQEAAQDRWWRFRCGEPNLTAYPYRCKRDLGHESPHVGLAGKEPIIWPGVGNAEPANYPGLGPYKCWCAPRRIDPRRSR